MPPSLSYTKMYVFSLSLYKYYCIFIKLSFCYLQLLKILWHLHRKGTDDWFGNQMSKRHNNANVIHSFGHNHRPVNYLQSMFLTISSHCWSRPPQGHRHNIQLFYLAPEMLMIVPNNPEVTDLWKTNVK